MSGVKVTPTGDRMRTGWWREAGWPPHLYKRRNSRRFYARVRVPPRAKSALGSHLARSLRTDHLQEARRRLPVEVAKLQEAIQACLRDPQTGALRSAPDTVDERARWWLAHMQQRGIKPGSDLPPDIEAGLDEEIERIAGRPLREDVVLGVPEVIYERDADAVRFADLVFGRSHPIGQGLDRYLAEREYPARTADKFQRATRRLRDYLSAEGLPDHVEQLSAQAAGRFVDHLYSLGLTTPTVNDHVSKLNTYWAWMRVRLGVKSNPWSGQSRRAKKSEPTAQKRPFTDDELRALLCGKTSRTLHDLMRIGALSGMRIEEIARQTVGGVRAGFFTVREGKTRASAREVPIHSALRPIIERRSAGKAEGDLLFHELKAPPSATKERSNRASNAFTLYRRRVGVDERAEGQRQSNVDFHSFRRWAATQAEEAGYLAQTIALVLGHEEGRRGMTLGRYSQPQMVETKRAIIESIKLPEGAPVDSPEGPLMGDLRRPSDGGSDN